MDRNTILAIVLSAAVLLGYELTFGQQIREYRQAEMETQEAAQPQGTQTSADTVERTPQTPGGAIVASLEEALSEAPGRVDIDTPALRGSINLAGGRLDDLVLKNYRETVDPDSPNIQLLRPQNVKNGQFIEQGWVVAGAPTAGKRWQVKSGETLTPQSPLVLTREEGGLVFTKTISVDDLYLFTIEQTVQNTTENAISLKPYALVFQRGIPDNLVGGAILHEGAVGIVGEKLYDRKFKKLAKGREIAAEGTGGWVGITNKYWLASAIPPQDVPFNAVYRNDGTETSPLFRTSYQLPAQIIEGKGTVSLTSYIFAGAKDVDILRGYEAKVEDGGLGITDLDKSVDWGSLNFLTRPIFWLLNFFGDLIGNFGVAILLLTLVIKALLFPLANKGYESMTKMKKLQPQLEKLKERHGDDKMKMQQEMMALYKREKLNPLAGCLPILIQMPIFFALYKVLFVTLELRHEPFIGWITDLSAPDPTSIFNLFGLLPYDPTAVPLIGTFLGLGVLPLIMGAAMWFQMSLSPPPPDPTQRQIMQMLPIVFTFLFAGFAAGLVIYWIWNTLLSIAQQVIIMKRNGVDVEWRDRFSFLFPKSKSDAKSPAE